MTIPGLLLTCVDDWAEIPVYAKAHNFDHVVAGEGKLGLFFC
jgi:hypothetical protein